MDSMLSGANYTPFLFVIFVGVVLLSLAFYFLLRKLDDLVKTVERERIMVDEKILVIKGLLDQLVGLHTTFRSLLVGPAKAEKEPAWGVEDLLPEDKLAQARARRRSARGGMEDDGPLPSAFFSEDAPAGGRRQPPLRREERRDEGEAGRGSLPSFLAEEAPSAPSRRAVAIRREERKDEDEGGHNITDFILPE